MRDRELTERLHIMVSDAEKRWLVATSSRFQVSIGSLVRAMLREHMLAGLRSAESLTSAPPRKPIQRTAVLAPRSRPPIRRRT
jgi:hypothetical protein